MVQKYQDGDQDINVYTVKEAATVLGVHADTVRRMGDAGRIRQFKSAGRNQIRLYPKAEIDQLAAGKEVSAKIWEDWEKEKAGGD